MGDDAFSEQHNNGGAMVTRQAGGNGAICCIFSTLRAESYSSRPRKPLQGIVRWRSGYRRISILCHRHRAFGAHSATRPRLMPRKVANRPCRRHRESRREERGIEQ